MNSLYKDGMSIIMKKIGFLCGCIAVILLLSAITWGSDIRALLQGPKPFKNMEAALIDGSKEHDELDHAYTSLSIDLITGSYAQYGEVKEQQMDKQTVYYLMPVNDGSYFITVIAHGNYVSSFDQMEQAFYNSIGKDEKDYPKPIEVQAGFKQLNEEELTYALDYFTAYDETIKTKEQLPQLLSPYAIVIDEIDSTSINSLWMILTSWIILMILCLIGLILYGSKFFMRTLQKDLNALNEKYRSDLDEDYKKATCIENLKIGDHLLYKKESWTWRVWEYEQFIWIYKKEILGKKQRLFEVCIFDQKGKKVTLWTGTEEKKAQKVLQKVFDHCTNALLGYESYIYEYWKEQPENLYQKLQELELIKQKEIEFRDQKMKAEKEKLKKAIKADNKKDEQKDHSVKKEKNTRKKKVNQTKEKTKQKAEKKKKAKKQEDESNSI